MRDPRSDARCRLDDAALLLAVTVDDDPRAFEGLLDRYEARIHRFVLRMIGDRHRAEDLAQEVFMRMYRQAASYDRARPFHSWLFAIARNVTLNDIRDSHRLKRRVVRSASDLADDDTGVLELTGYTEETPLSAALREEARRTVVAALQRLKPHHRAALVLREYDDMAYEDIADVLETTLATVKSWIHRARIHLAEALAEAGVGR